MVSVLVSVADSSAPKPLLHKQLELEAEVGIEPTNAAFAEPCLTTWLPRHQFRRSLVPSATGSKLKFAFSRYFLNPSFSRCTRSSRGLNIPWGVMTPVINSAGVTSNPGLHASLVGLDTRRSEEHTSEL